MTYRRPYMVEVNIARGVKRREQQLTRYKVSDSECWIWTGGTSSDGYGKVKRKGKSVRAHRVFYEHFVGNIPDGMFVCHTCDTPLCVNPAHLWVGTHAQNEKDKDVKGRRSPSPSTSHPHLVPKGEKHPKHKLTNQNVSEILQSQETSYVLAEKFGVDPSTIQRVRKKETWKHHPHAAGFVKPVNFFGENTP